MLTCQSCTQFVTPPPLPKSIPHTRAGLFQLMPSLESLDELDKDGNEGCSGNRVVGTVMVRVGASVNGRDRNRATLPLFLACYHEPMRTFTLSPYQLLRPQLSTDASVHNTAITSVLSKQWIWMRRTTKRRRTRRRSMRRRFSAA